MRSPYGMLLGRPVFVSQHANTFSSAGDVLLADLSYYLTKLLANDAVKSYIQRHEPEILEQFELVVNTVSMEEAVQQQADTTPSGIGEASEP